jgi:hypothetical protein
MAVVSGPVLSDRLTETLYTEALLLADETHAYYDLAGRAERGKLEPRERVQFACEALKATTRLMHVIAWLATRRAIATGEVVISVSLVREQQRLGIERLGDAVGKSGATNHGCCDPFARLHAIGGVISERTKVVSGLWLAPA